MKGIYYIGLIVCTLVYACADKRSADSEVFSKGGAGSELKRAFADFHGNLKAEDFEITSIDTLTTEAGAVYECAYSTVDGVKGEFLVSTMSIEYDGTVAVVPCKFKEKHVFAMPMKGDGQLDYTVGNDRLCTVSLCDNRDEEKVLKVGVLGAEEL